MSFESFKSRVIRIIDMMGGEKPSVRFHHDSECGKHYADFSDGTTIVGNSQSVRVAVLWGSGHHALAEL